MNRAIRISPLLLLFLLMASSAGAEDAEGPADKESFVSRDRYFYLAGGLALGQYLDLEEHVEDLLADVGLFAEVKDGKSEPIGVDLRGGYRIHRNLAAELQFMWWSGPNIKVGTAKKAVDLESWTATANLKGYLLTKEIEAALAGGRIQPFVTVGVGWMQFDLVDKLDLGIDSDGEDLAVRFGGGIEFHAPGGTGLYMDATYVMATGDIDGLDYFGLLIGVIYGF